LAHYKQKQLNYIKRLKDIRYPKLLFDCRPIGRRRSRRTLWRPQPVYKCGRNKEAIL